MDNLKKYRVMWVDYNSDDSVKYDIFNSYKVAKEFCKHLKDLLKEDYYIEIINLK